MQKVIAFLALALKVALRLVAQDELGRASHRLLSATYPLKGSRHLAGEQVERFRYELFHTTGRRSDLTLEGVVEWMARNGLSPR